MRDNTWRRLLTTDPFVPCCADPAGFKVRFVYDVSAARARDIAGAVLQFNPDAAFLGEALASVENADDSNILDALGEMIHAAARTVVGLDH